MKNRFTAIATLIICCSSVHLNPVYGQGTFTSVYTILQSNCSGSACHSGAGAVAFSVDGSETDVYNALVGVDAVNAVARGKRNKLVATGDGPRSFLLRKIANNLTPELSLASGEVGMSHADSVSLTAVEFEIIRQWILYGAPASETVIDENMLIEYYSGKGLPEIPVPPTPADEGKEGLQLHFGPVFLAPGQEIEYFFKYFPELAEDVEVINMQAYMNWQSHHFVLFDLDTTATFGQGYKEAVNLNNQATVHLSSDLMGIWQFEGDIKLPEGTAFFWEKNTAAILNYHIKNYNHDTILAANAYFNIYTRPKGSGAKEMHMHILSYGGFEPFNLKIPPTGQLHTLDFDFYAEESSEIWNVWSVQSHTHKLGKDFDIYLRNANGSRGDKIYEGFYNTDYSFNQGFYDFTHPAIRRFEPLMQVSPTAGFVCEASWLNPGTDTVGFGLTTEGEMFVAYIHYTKDEVSGILSGSSSSDDAWTVYPNPSEGVFFVTFQVDKASDVAISLLDISGSLVREIAHGDYPAGDHRLQFSKEELGIPAGAYIVKLQSANAVTAKKLVLHD